MEFFIEALGQLGTKSGDFNLPTTIEVDSQGNFFVNERGNERIQKFDKDWNLILMWVLKEVEITHSVMLNISPFNKYNNVYVTDPQSDPGWSQKPRVLKFDSEGDFITKWGNAYGKEDGQFQDPEHLAIDSERNVYVSDRKRDDIQKFMPVIFDKGGT